MQQQNKQKSQLKYNDEQSGKIDLPNQKKALEKETKIIQNEMPQKINPVDQLILFGTKIIDTISSKQAQFTLKQDIQKLAENDTNDQKCFDIAEFIKNILSQVQYEMERDFHLIQDTLNKKQLSQDLQQYLIEPSQKQDPQEKIIDSNLKAIDKLKGWDNEFMEESSDKVPIINQDINYSQSKQNQLNELPTDSIKKESNQNKSGQSINRSKRKSSDEEINLELTFKTKVTKNNNLGSTYKNDTLTYSNSNFFESAKTPLKGISGLKYQSNKPNSREAENHPQTVEDINANIERTSSRQYAQSKSNEKSERLSDTETKRFIGRKKLYQKEISQASSVKKIQHMMNLEDEKDNKFKKIITNSNEMDEYQIRIYDFQQQFKEKSKSKSQRKNTQERQFEGSVFKTEITEYKEKISKIRQSKQQKKKRLELELQKVNRELDSLNKKQVDMLTSPPIHGSNNYESRVKISDDNQAKLKAERLIKNLRSEKRSRKKAHVNEISSVDKNINKYMQELMEERYKNEEKMKQKKKLQIIERMKQAEMRKIVDQSQKQKSIQFVKKLQSNVKPMEQDISRKMREQDRSRKMETKISEPLFQQIEMTPELSKKKSYLQKVRNITFKRKNLNSVYDQNLQ